MKEKVIWVASFLYVVIVECVIDCVAVNILMLWNAVSISFSNQQTAVHSELSDTATQRHSYLVTSVVYRGLTSASSLWCGRVMSWLNVQLRGMLSGDDASKEQIERQVLNIWDKMYKTWFAKVVLLFI